MPATSDNMIARHNARVLACAQALGGANPSIVVSLGGLVGQTLADKGIATLPVSLLNLGLALGTIPAAMVMRLRPARPLRRARNPVAHPRHVRPELRHRAPDRALRQGADHRRRT